MRILLLPLLCLSAIAFQTGIATIGLDRPKFEEAVRSAARGGSLSYPAGLIGKAAVDKFKGLSPEARAAVVKDALQAAKALISTPAFAKAHDAWLAEERNAVNHGGGVKSDVRKKMEANPEAGMKDMMSVAAAQLVEGLRKIDNKQALKMMLDQDLESGDAKLKKIAPLLDSNLSEFRKQYSLWKSSQMGGPATEAEYQAALGKAGSFNSQEAQAEQQRRYDEQNLKVTLRKELDKFIAVASAVDFAAQTKQDGKTVRFVRSDYEQKPWDWKLMYRAGRAPVQAALEFARAWRKDL